MAFYNPTNRQARELIPGVSIRTFWGDEMLVSVVDLDANAHIPRHSHPHEQSGMVLTNEIELTIDQETRIVTPGEVYIIPGGVDHEVRTSNEPAKLMEVFSPVREEYKY